MTTDNKIIDVIKRVEPPVVSAGYLSKHVEIGQERCRQRLKRLSEQNKLQEDKLVQMSIYWLSD